jgi:hypothetical protein
MSGTPPQRTLRRALELLGNVDRLAIALDVPRSDIQHWLEGEEPPLKVFLEALDLVAYGTKSQPR